MMKQFSIPATLLLLFIAGCASSPQSMQIQQAIALLDSPDQVERSNAASRLRQFGSESIAQLMRTAQNDTGRKRSKAIFILGQIGDPEICQQFEALLKKSDPPLPPVDRAIIVDILGDIGGAKYLTLFRSMLRTETSPDIKFALAYRLSKLGDESGTQYLTQHWMHVLETETERRQILAAHALKKLHGQDFGADAKQWKEWLVKKGKATQQETERDN